MAKLKKILWHIIVNGLKYTKEGGVYVHLTYTVQPYGLNLCVDVEDTGIGMKEEDLEVLFSPFKRIEEQRNRSIEGTGLGMSITNQLLALMGCNLEVKSTYGKGSGPISTFAQSLLLRLLNFNILSLTIKRGA